MYSRTTTSGMYGTLLGSLQESLAHVQDLQRQLATNNKYAKLSDNPTAVTRGLELESTLAATEKYMQNGQNAISMLNYSEGALNTVLDAAQSIRDLVIQAGDGALGADELQDIVHQIEAKRQTILDALNSKVAGQYIFGGTDTSTPPFSMTSDGRIVYNGSDQRIQYALGDGLLGDVTFAGSEIVPTDENTYFICSHRVPLDWEWTGREEKVQITVGNRTLAVFIPEQWVDEIASQKAEMSDYNRFRDPGELSGISLDDLASLVNRSLQEQGADMLVTATVEKNMATGEQQMFIKSNTGEKVGITGWTDTDYMPVCQSLEGLDFELTYSSGSSNKLHGGKELSLSGLKGKTLTIVSGSGTVTCTFEENPANENELVSKLNEAFDAKGIKDTGPKLTADVSDGELVLTSNSGNSIQVSGTAAQQLFTSNSWDSSNILIGDTKLSLSDLKDKTLTVESGGEKKTFRFDATPSTNADLKDKIDEELSSLGITASVNEDGKLVLTSAKGKDITVSGTAAQQLFGSVSTSEGVKYNGITGTENVLDWRGGEGTLEISLNEDTSEPFNLKEMRSISDLVNAINAKMPVDAGDLPVASIVSGRLVLQSAKGTLKVTGDKNDLKDLLGTDGTETSVESSASSLSVTLNNDTANTVKIYMNKGDSLAKIAEKINSLDGVFARTSTDGKKLVVVAQRVGDLPEDPLHVDEAEESKHYPPVTLQATGAAKALFAFNAEGSIQSEPATRAVDHSHMDVFDLLGMETAMKSVEFDLDQKLTVKEGEPLHWRVMSGGHTADITLTPGDYTMTQLADRLKNAGAGWLEVTVDVVNPNGLNQDMEEKGVGTNDYEAATQRLVIRGYNGEQVLFLDMNEQHYADEMGLSTALRTEPDMGLDEVYFPQAPCVDDKLGVTLRVQMNCGMTYDVNITKKAVSNPVTGLVDRRKVMQEIVNQVNAQEGETIMGITIPLDSKDHKEIPEAASIYFLSGESFTVVDMPFSDPVWEDYSGGIAAQMGIHGGVTANMAAIDKDKRLMDSATFGDYGVSGTIRFSNLAHSVEIDVGENDTVKDVMDRLRSQAGDWLYVNYFDSHMGGAENRGGRQSGDYPIIAISSRDGSAVCVVDVKGKDSKGTAHIAQDYLGLSTGIEGTENLLKDGENSKVFAWDKADKAFKFGVLQDNGSFDTNAVEVSTLTLDVAGYQHTIDLTELRDANDDGKVDAKDMVAFINARMQDYDVEAGINEDGQLTVWSPRGFEIGIDFTRELEGTADGDYKQSYDLTSIWDGTSWVGNRFSLTVESKTFDFDLTSDMDLSGLAGKIGDKLGIGYKVEVSGAKLTLTKEAITDKEIDLSEYWDTATQKWQDGKYSYSITVDGKTFDFELGDPITDPVKLADAIKKKLGGNYNVIGDNDTGELTLTRVKMTPLDASVEVAQTNQFLGTGQAVTYYRGGYDLDMKVSERLASNEKLFGIHGQNATIRSGANTTRQNAFGMLDDVIAAVKSGNRDALVDKMLPRVDAFINNILGVMSTNGALVNRYDANMSRQANEALIMTDEHDKLVKPDYSEVTSQLLLANYVYQANLAVISRLIQPSLLDFLS